MDFVDTARLRIAFDQSGASSGLPLFLLHGWPDAPESWSRTAPLLKDYGFRLITPYLRGTHPTEFRSAAIPRFAGAVAMAQDVIDLADRLGIDRFAVIGHDWGARIGYTLAALFAERVHALAALGLAYQPRGEFPLGSLAQSRQFWYQFFQCTDAGAQAVRDNPVAFARMQWETWSPTGWFTEADFREVRQHFVHPDWAEVTLNAYRSRYLKGDTVDHAYDDLQETLKATEQINVPTLLIQGASDSCDLPSGAEGKEQFFRKSYERLLLEGVGHFPHREAPEAVAAAILRLLDASAAT